MKVTRVSMKITVAVKEMVPKTIDKLRTAYIYT